MNSTIIAAIIGGLSTVIASVGTLLITRILNENHFYQRSKRQRCLGGHWEGTAHQALGPEGIPIDYQIDLTLKITRRVVSGEGSVRFLFKNQNVTRHLSLVRGCLIFDRFLRIEYEGKDTPEQVEFGYALLELSPDGQRLDGHFLGFSAFFGEMIFGTDQLHRSGSIPSHVSASAQTTV